MKWTGKVTIESMTEVICAIHLSSYVESPYKDRGGLMLVGPAGVLKTTLLDVLDENYHNSLSISNAYMSAMKKLQPSFYNGQIRSICLPDMQSIYAGDPRTAGRIEQMMMQLSGEATRTIGGDQDSRWAKFKGYCTMFAALTDNFYDSHITKWDTTGFARRFLWCTYTLADADILMRAIEQWTRAAFGSVRIPKIPLNGFIPDTLTTEQRVLLRSWLRHQPQPHEIQFQVLCKAASVLSWHYKENKIKKSAIETMHHFAETLQHDAALLILPEQKYDKMSSAKMPSKGNGTTSRHVHAGHRRKSVLRASPKNNSHQRDDSSKQTPTTDEHGTVGSLPAISEKQN